MPVPSQCADGPVNAPMIVSSITWARSDEAMSLSLYRVPDGHSKGQSELPCPSVYSPTTALRSLSSVALSSALVLPTLTQHHSPSANQRLFLNKIWGGFLAEATNHISSGFLREAIGGFFKAAIALPLLRLPLWIFVYDSSRLLGRAQPDLEWMRVSEPALEQCRQLLHDSKPAQAESLH
jgi:hypothetical protein